MASTAQLLSESIIELLHVCTLIQVELNDRSKNNRNQHDELEVKQEDPDPSPHPHDFMTSSSGVMQRRTGDC